MGDLNMNEESTNVVPFKKKAKLSDKVKNFLASQPALKEKLDQFLQRIPEEDKIEAIELIVRRQYLGE